MIDVKEYAKEKVDEAEELYSNNKRTMIEIAVGIVSLIAFNCILKGTKKRTDKASFELGKMAGRAEFAEELASLAIKKPE